MKLMKQEQDDKISVVRGLFRKYEYESKHKERLRYFEDALELLDQYIDDEPDSNLVLLAKTMRQTYTKNLLELLPELNTLDFDDWSHYAILLLTKLDNEVEYLSQGNKTLKKYFNNFILIWSDEVINILKKHTPVT